MIKRIKVMQIIPNLALAGAEIMVENLVIGLLNEGYEVSVVSLFNEETAITKRLENQNVPLFYLGKKKGLDMKVVFRLYELFLREKPTIVHTHRYAMQYAIPAAIMAKVPVKIHTIHNIADKEVSKIQRKLHYLFYRYFRVVPVSISPLVKQSVVKEYKLPEERIAMIFNGIELKKCIQKKDYGNENKKMCILHIGRFSEAKNQLGLVECFKIIHDNFPNTVLKLIGVGDFENLVRAKVKELGLENCVSFLGLQSDVYPYLNKADVFVLPSFWEGMPITLIEAMATGLPLVATKVGGVPDMIEDNVTGLLVDSSKEQITKALVKLVSDSDLRKRLGNSAKVASTRFSVQEMTLQYIKLYKKEMEIRKVLN